jgi:hypothetical protein
MDKIASPQELQSELRRLLAYSESRNPSRKKLESAMRSLAGRVAQDKRSAGQAMYSVTDIEMTTTEDSFEGGEIGHSMRVLSEHNVGRYKTPQEMMQRLTSKYDLPKDKDNWLAFEDGRIDVQFHVDENNSRVEGNDPIYKKWKEGAAKLWSADFHIWFVVSEERTPTPEEIAKDFGISAY